MFGKTGRELDKSEIIALAVTLLRRMSLDGMKKRLERFNRTKNLALTIRISKSDQEYLDRTVATLKRTRRKTNKSELVALGLALLRAKSSKEVVRLTQLLPS